MVNVVEVSAPPGPPQRVPSRDARHKDDAVNAKLARLKSMRDEGLISGDDFAKKERALLAQLSTFEPPVERTLQAKLRKLKAMRDEELISDQDFAKKKQALLEQPGIDGPPLDRHGLESLTTRQKVTGGSPFDVITEVFLSMRFVAR